MRTLVAGALVIVALLLVPTVIASHNMGHRYLVHGRILDSDGMPVQNQEIEIRMLNRGTYYSSLVARTDCLGDFDSWKAIREGPAGAAPHGGGEIEGPLNAPNGGQYYNFHMHDEYLSSNNEFELRMLNETFKAGFDSRTRQTSVMHQLTKQVAPAASCGGNFDEFNRTFEVRVFVAHTREMTSAGEPVAPPRTITVSVDGTESSGQADFMSTYVAKLQNVTVAEGKEVKVEATTLGSKTERISAEEAKFRRLDSLNAVSGTGESALGGLKVIGIIALVIIVIAALYFGGQKLKAKREESKLLQGSTRRRFRKDRNQP